MGTLCRISEIIPAALLATAFGESGKSTHPGVLGEFGAVAARRTRFLYEKNGAAIELPLVYVGVGAMLWADGAAEFYGP